MVASRAHVGASSDHGAGLEMVDLAGRAAENADRFHGGIARLTVIGLRERRFSDRDLMLWCQRLNWEPKANES